MHGIVAVTRARTRSDCRHCCCFTIRPFPKDKTSPVIIPKIFAVPSCSALGKRRQLDWAQVGGELYRARELLFEVGTGSALALLSALLELTVSRASVALECPSIAAAVCHSLAQVLAAGDASTAQKLALVHLALTLLPRDAHHMCSPWPLQGREVVEAFTRLATTVGPVARAPVTSRLNVALVTACAATNSAKVVQESWENRQAYGKLHGYDLHFFRTAGELTAELVGGLNLSTQNAPAFWRAHAIFRALDDSRGPYEWVLWLDCEALITSAQSVNELVAHLEDGEFIATADEFGLRPEVLFLRDTAFTRRLLDRWRLGRPPGAALGEVASLQHALLQHWEAWTRHQPMTEWSSLSWPPQVRLAPTGMLSAPRRSGSDVGSWGVRMWQEGDFAWHDPFCSGHRETCAASVEDPCCHHRIVPLGAAIKSWRRTQHAT